MKIIVNKCRYTGKLFDDNTKYAKHLAKMRIIQKEKRLHAKIKNEFNDWLAKEKESIVSSDMISPWILKNQKYLMNASNAFINFDSDKFYDTDTFLKLDFNIGYRNSIPNRGWCPDRRPGWTGHVKGSLKRLSKHDWNYPSADILDLLNIRTGSGGGGNKNWCYEVTLFLDDWPNLAQELTFSIIKG